jgi:hypothetical protein
MVKGYQGDLSIYYNNTILHVSNILLYMAHRDIGRGPLLIRVEPKCTTSIFLHSAAADAVLVCDGFL